MFRLLMATASVACLTLTSSACSDAVHALGASPERASGNAVTMLHALADRFGPVELSPEVARSRPLLARYSTTPSRIFDDRDMWTSMSDSTRVIEIGGEYENGRYVLAHQPGMLTPTEPGNARHVMHLQRLGDNEYRWRSEDEVALGAATPTDFDRALTSLFRAAERTDAPTIRALTSAAFPRATGSIERLLVLDSLRRTPHSDGSASLVIGIGIRPATAERVFESLGPYARKYWLPMRWHVRVQDPSGLAWSEFTKRDSTIVLRLRVRDGSLAPLDGQRTTLGRHVRLFADASAKVGPFRVGVRGLVIDAMRGTRPGYAALTLRFLNEPDWQLPPLVARLLRAPLRRPFEGSGSMMRYGLRSEAGHSTDPMTVVFRDIDATVRESAILRFLGRLGGTALGDFRQGAERDAERLYAETLRAMASDIQAPRASAASTLER